MSGLEFCAIFIVGCLGSAAAASAVCLNKVLLWRIRWIELEHESARKEGREPRDIDAAFRVPTQS